MNLSLRLLTAAAAVHGASALSAGASATANPIRRVVTMLQNVQKKVEAEAEVEEALFKKYICYCKTAGGDLAKGIAALEAKGPELMAAIEEGTAQKAQLEGDLVSHKADRKAAKIAMAEAKVIREKEAAAFEATKADFDANIGAIGKAVAALEKGMGGAFLQSSSASVLKNFVQSSDNMEDSERQELTAFLASEQGSEYAPQGGAVTGILKQMGDEMAKGLADATADEEAAMTSYSELTNAKNKEVEALTKAIEVKTVRVGELAVNLANMKNDLGDGAESLEEDKKFLADLEKNCGTKEAEWEEIKKIRAEEQVALADTIKLLNDDDALELFKKALPSAAASLIQLDASMASARARALAALSTSQRATVPQQFDFIALALRSKKVGFEKVLKMIDEMVVLLKTEQTDDDGKKEYCAAEFDKTDDKKKGLERSISDSEKAIAAAEEGISTLTSEIEALAAGVTELDKTVAQATEQRKEENEDYKTLMAQDSGAKELLGIAKNRLNKFYNPKLYLPPPKRELTEAERIEVNMGGTLAPTPAPGGIAGTGVTVLAEVSVHQQDTDAPPPPPEAPGAYKKKGEETNGVIAMLDMLVKDLDKEMTVAEAEEKDAQADYEKVMKDSADKRAADSKMIEEKEAAKADMTAALETHNTDKTSLENNLKSTLETIAALHSECDWLIQYYDARKEARTNEIDSLTNAKAVLNGADFSFLQTNIRRLRGA